MNNKMLFALAIGLVLAMNIVPVSAGFGCDCDGPPQAPPIDFFIDDTIEDPDNDLCDPDLIDGGGSISYSFC